MPDPCIKCIINGGLIAPLAELLADTNVHVRNEARSLASTARAANAVYTHLRDVGLLQQFVVEQPWRGCDHAKTLIAWAAEPAPNANDFAKMRKIMNGWRERILEEIKDAVSGE